MICILENKSINKEHFDCVFENSLKNEDIIYLVYRDEKIEGFLSFKIHHYLHHDHDTSEIVELVILPEKRSLKIGKQLIEKDAHRFYERQGYEKSHYNYTKELDD